MKKFYKLGICLSLITIFGLLLTGCLDIEMKVNNDGSCELKYVIDTQGKVDASEVEEYIKSAIGQANENADKKVASLKSVKSKDGVITAVIKVNDISQVGYSFFGKYSDFEKESSRELDNIVDAKSGDSIEREDIKGANGLNVVMVSGIDTGVGELSELRIIVPGKVKYMSSNASLAEGQNNTVKMRNGIGFVIYERGGGASWLIYVLIIVILAAGAVFVKKSMSKPASVTVGNTAPANVGAAVPTGVGAASANTGSAAPAVKAPQNMIRCPGCNAEQVSGTKFCALCGTKMDSGE